MSLALKILQDCFLFLLFAFQGPTSREEGTVFSTSPSLSLRRLSPSPSPTSSASSHSDARARGGRDRCFSSPGPRVSRRARLPRVSPPEMKAARGESAQTLLFSSTSSWSSLKASKREREGREERSSVSPGRLKGEGQTKKRGERQGKPLKAKRREIILVNPTEFRFCALSYDLPSFVELKPFPFRWRLSIPETSFQGLLLEELRLPFRWSCYPSVFGFNEAMKVLRGKGKPNGAAGEELSDPRENNVGKNSNFSVADKVFSNLSTVSSFFSRAFSFFLPLEKKKRRPQDGTPSSLHQTDQPVSPEKPSPSPSLDCSFEISISKLSLPSLSSSSGSGSGFGGGVRCNLEVRDQGGKGKGKGLPNREWNVKRQNGSSRKRGGPRSVYDPPDCASIAEPLRCRLETGEGTQSDNPQAFTFVYFDTNRKKGAWKWLNL